MVFVVLWLNKLQRHKCNFQKGKIAENKQKPKNKVCLKYLSKLITIGC